MSEGNERCGVGISPGVAVGPIFLLKSAVGTVSRRTLADDRLDGEVERLRVAWQEALEQFERQRAEFSRTFDSPEARIFEAHLQFYQDDVFRGSIEKRIRDAKINGEAAIQDEIEHVSSMLRSTDSLFQERIADIRDVGNRICRTLLKREQASLAAGTDPFVLYARELLPSDTMGVDRGRLLAIVTEVGGEKQATWRFWPVPSAFRPSPAFSGSKRTWSPVPSWPWTEIKAVSRSHPPAHNGRR